MIQFTSNLNLKSNKISLYLTNRLKYSQHNVIKNMIFIYNMKKFNICFIGKKNYKQK